MHQLPLILNRALGMSLALRGTAIAAPAARLSPLVC